MFSKRSPSNAWEPMLSWLHDEANLISFRFLHEIKHSESIWLIEEPNSIDVKEMHDLNADLPIIETEFKGIDFKLVHLSNAWDKISLSLLPCSKETEIIFVAP